jgi:hypothetical protein
MSTYTENPEFKRSADGGLPLCRVYTEGAATQTFNAGELATLSSGLLVDYTANSLVLGIHTKAATGTAGTEHTIQLIRPGDEIEISVTNNGTDAAVTVANLGIGYGTYVAGSTTSRKTYLDINSSTNIFTITKIISAGTASTVPARVIVTLSPAYAQYGGAGV